ncbi:hypothetical protein P7C70_g4619, partial [Phenoliferia sp. Uapishka_3]
MPSLKETTINASFFPGAGGEHDHVEDAAQTAIRTGKRDLSEHPSATTPSTGPSSITDAGGKGLQPIFGTPATEQSPCLALPSAQFSRFLSSGTIAAPTYCGYIDKYAGWRWIEWVHMIANGVLFVAEVFFLKETRGAKILSGRAKQLRKETGNNNIKSPAELETESIKELLTKSSTKAIVLMCREPVVFAFGFWIAMAWGITFLFLSVIPLTFAGNHHWSEGNAGLPSSIRAKSKYAVAEGELPSVNDEEKLNARPAIAPEAVQTSGLV